jgi:flagellar basal-body rod protein FlgB
VAITDIPILSMLRTRLNWNQERQRVLAENVSNSDTPGFRERDLVPPKFEEPTGMRSVAVSTVSLAQTERGHIGTSGLSNSGFQTETKSYDVRPTGNSVNLEDEMMKVAANQMDYQAATALYSRSLNLLKTAIGRR